MASMPPEASIEPPGGHEESHFNLRAYVWFIVIFVLAGAAIHVIVWVSYAALIGGVPVRPVSPIAEQTPRPPEPRQQGSFIHAATPREDLAAMRAEEQRILNGYGWVDRQAGLARIPIARAMELTLERGVSAGRAVSSPVATQPVGGVTQTRPAHTTTSTRSD